MTFQSAAVFWWLLPLCGAILALYVLKMRRRDVRVPATFLWPRLTADVRANAPFQRLRVSLLLILQLLVVVLIVTALANPLRKSRGLHGGATVIVLDASASMGARDVAPTRFQAAVSRVRSIVDTMTPGDRLALVEAGATTRVIFPLTGDKPRMASALRSVRATDAPNDMGEALRLAAALVGQREGGRIVVLSDGAFPTVGDFSPGKARIVFEQIGTGSRNVAITALESADMPDGTTQLYAGVRNYDSQSVKATITFVVDGIALDARSIDVPPRQTIPETVVLPATARQVSVSLAADIDLLACDNSASIFLHGAGGERVLLVTTGDLFLERALALEPGVHLDKAPGVPDYERAGTPGAPRYDIVVFDGLPPVPVKAPAVLSFGGADGMPVVDSGPSPKPRLVAWRRDDAVLKYVELHGILIQTARRVSAKPEGRVLAEGSDGPLMVESESGGRKALYVAFTALDSDWPLRVSFPIFVSNAVTWLSGGHSGGESAAFNVRTGRGFAFPTPGKAGSLTLKRPDGSTVAIDAASGVATVRDADLAGLYTLSGKGVHTSIAANLTDEAESDVTPRATLDLSGSAVAATTKSIALAETWRPILLIGLFAMAVEWWVFARRS
jgi:hypothetical protein